ncbi:hypothetical protein C8Q76DRAFT_740214 [Earliella scabrosa]|nr:hypothetical protein C8Q76DRAFT_740214 [Earliella scabrosa]
MHNLESQRFAQSNIAHLVYAGHHHIIYHNTSALVTWANVSTAAVRCTPQALVRRATRPRASWLFSWCAIPQMAQTSSPSKLYRERSTLLFYEHSLTVMAEVKLFWNRWTGAAILFFMNRYIPLLLSILNSLSLAIATAGRSVNPSVL